MLRLLLFPGLLSSSGSMTLSWGNRAHSISNGVIREEETELNDNESKTTTYHADGSLESERFYKDGSPHGVWKYYNKRGELTAIREYKNGRKNGRWSVFTTGAGSRFVKWYDNDVLVRSALLSKDDDELISSL